METTRNAEGTRDRDRDPTMDGEDRIDLAVEEVLARYDAVVVGLDRDDAEAVTASLWTAFQHLTRGMRASER